MESYIALKHSREKGLKILYELYAKKMLDYASHKWKIEHDTAWDLIYKTIYKTADVSDQYEFQSEQKFASFIFKIFINHIRDHLRQSKRICLDFVKTEFNDKLINNRYNDDVEKNAVADPKLKILEAELNKLEDWQRILLLLRSQDMSYDEIVNYTGKPGRHLKVYYARLKKHLTVMINKQLGIKEKQENV